MAPVILDYAPSIERIEPNLTLAGLALIHRKLTADKS
jgi:hypothetical protein